jgi:hypothetical protein
VDNLTQADEVAVLKPFTCRYCNTKFVVIDTYSGSLLPVEIKEGGFYYKSDKFESSKHVSHLKNCQPRQLDWETVKKYYFNNPGARFTWVPKLKPLPDAIDEAGEVQKKKHRDNAVLPGTQEYERIKAEFNQQLKKDEQ